MSRTFIKICGITRIQDALIAELAGADAIGFIFVPNTKRFIDPIQATQISQALGPFIARVGVFRNAHLETILSTVTTVGLTAVQLHGDESDAFAFEIQKICPVIRALHVTTSLEFPSGTLLLDGPNPGSGRAFDWDNVNMPILKNRRWLLAGGLTPENVGFAIQKLQPWGVDVSSGVELLFREDLNLVKNIEHASQQQDFSKIIPGIKDSSRILNFIKAVRNTPKLSTS